MKKLLSSLIGIAAFSVLSAQCSVIEVPLVQRVNQSTTIVEGAVTSQYSYWNSDNTMIYTANVVELYKIFKGNVTGESIEIITEGGTVGMNRISVEPSLTLNVGDVGMFTCIPVTRVKNNPLSRNALPQFEAYASLQGFVKYDEAANTASDPFRTYLDLQTEVYNVCGPAGHHQYIEVKPRPDHSTQRAGDEVQAGISITSFTPTTLTAGTGTVLTINGTGFGAVQGSGTVGFKNADDGGATYINPLQTQILSWTTSQITVEVPANAGTGTITVTNGSAQTATSAGTLTVTYAHLNVDFDPGSGTMAYQTDHVNDDGSGGYTWKMSTGFAGDAPAVAAFTRAFDSWRCSSGIYWTIGSNTAVNDAVSDGTNVICYDNTAPLSAGILGVCYSYWAGCANGPTIVWYVSELDIIFDEGSNIAPLTWNYGTGLPTVNEYDFESVAVHELGHGHQLGHVINPGAIMHYAISNGASNRSLSADDISGSNFVQQKSIITNVCGPGAMATYVCGSLPVAAFTVNSQTGCVGQTFNFTDQSTGSPTSWQWTFTGGAPSSSTQQNPSVFYTTPGTYDVTLVATNASGSDSHTINGYITVSANPTITVTGNPSNLTVCNGEPLTLTASGAQSYSWSGGITNGVPFTPASSTTYFVTGTNAAGCQASSNADVFVNPTPTLSIVSNPSNGVVCSGNQATLTASGAQSYSWTGGISNGVAFTPVATTTYTVTGTGSNGCTSTAQSTITVNNCSIPTTTVPCGATITNKSQSLSAVNVPGAVQYRFKFYDNVTLALVGSNTIPTRTLVFNNVPNITYGHTYRWTVAVNMGSGFGAESSMNCTVTLAVPTTTLPCNQTYNRYNGYSAVPARAGVVGYRFSFYDNVTSALVGQVTQASSYIYFNTVSQLAVGTTYKWRVEVQYFDGTSNVFGPASNANCIVTMAAPSTTVPCNATYNCIGGYSACPATPNATGYRFTFYQNSVMVAQRAQTGNYIYFSQVAGISNGQTYQWTVEVQYNPGSGNVYGPASTPCNVTFSSTARQMDPLTQMEQPTDNSDFNFGISMYPNPIGNGVNPTLNITGADQQNAVVTVMDLTGRTVATYNLFVEGNEYTTELTEFPDLVAGMYLMQVTVGDKVQSQKFIAE